MIYEITAEVKLKVQFTVEASNEEEAEELGINKVYELTGAIEEECEVEDVELTEVNRTGE